jgi:uncharacterized protein (DUF2126 family)
VVSGESLPRWGYSIFWRKDGVPIWRDESLIAGDRLPEDSASVVDAEDAALFLRETATVLGVAPDNVAPVYEDALEWIVREAELPENTVPTDPKLDDPVRQRFVRTFQRGLTQPVGHVLPIQRMQPWQARRAHAGASGIRKVETAARPCSPCRVTARSAIACRSPRCPMFRPHPIPIHPRDTAEPREPLADLRRQAIERAVQTRDALTQGDCPPKTAAARRRAMTCTAPARPVRPASNSHRHRRRGAHRAHGRAQGRPLVRVHPPVETLEDYLDLVACVEAVAQEPAFRCGSKAIRRHPIRA